MPAYTVPHELAVAQVQGHVHLTGSAFRLAGVEVTWAAVTTLALSVAFTLATEQFLARTRTGLQLRALSQRPMAAELIGIRVRLLALGVWAVTGAVTAFALMIIAPLRSPDFSSLSLLVVPAFYVVTDRLRDRRRRRRQPGATPEVS